MISSIKAAMQWFADVFGRLRSAWIGLGPEEPRIVLRGQSIAIVQPDGRQVEIGLSDVISLVLARRDEITTDLLMIEVGLEGLPHSYILHEEMQGFYEAVEAFRRFDGFAARWDYFWGLKPFSPERVVAYQA